MREMITEATRTIEDSQTAQALHGLLSLKSPESSHTNTVALQQALGQQVIPGQPATLRLVPAGGGEPTTLTVPADIPPVGSTVVVSSDSPASSTSTPAATTTTVSSAQISSPSHTTTTASSGTGNANSPGTGPMVQLLLQMQSQAEASKKQSESQPSVSTHTPSASAHVLLKRQLDAAKKPAAGQSSPNTDKTTALAKLIRAQLPPQPVQCNPSKVAAFPAPNRHALAPAQVAALSKSPVGTQNKGVQQIILQPSSEGKNVGGLKAVPIQVMGQIIQLATGPDGSCSGSQPLVIQPLTVQGSKPVTGATNVSPVIVTSKDAADIRTPPKKRLYQKVGDDKQPGETSPKTVKYVVQQVDAGSKVVKTMPSDVRYIVQQVEASGANKQTVAAMPMDMLQLANNGGTAVATAVTPPAAKRVISSTTTESRFDLPAVGVDELMTAVTEGYNQVFKLLQTSAESLKQQGNILAQECPVKSLVDQAISANKDEQTQVCSRKDSRITLTTTKPYDGTARFILTETSNYFVS